MRGYANDEDLDEYEEDGEEEEEYEEEEEERKPTEDELKFLEIRQKFKEALRLKNKKEMGSSLGNSRDKSRRLPNDNYGSFFGPSQPVIAQRVIEESKSLLENRNLAARISNSGYGLSKRAPASTNSERRPVAREPPPRVIHESKMKAQKLKNNRDYSFLLSEDSELPVPKKEPVSRNVSVPNSDARLAQAQHKSRQTMSNHSKPFSNGREERRSVPTHRQMQTKSAPHQMASGSKRPNMPLADSRKQLGGNSGTGPGRPTGQKGLPSKLSAPTKVSNQGPSLTVERKASLVGTKKPAFGMQKEPLSRPHSSLQKPQLEQKRVIHEPEKARLKPKMSVASSKPQVNMIKPARQIAQRASMQVDHAKKRSGRPSFDDEEDEDPSSIIRRMFRYDPRKYVGRDDDDDRNMEANFDDIEREEKRSSRIAREEDEREARLIEEEERRERMRKEAKRRRLSQR
ncbi:hypothetical protein AQUCO_02700059v1 [Aquilegia coerulea]|uniref:SPT2 chromatin protein n=1 Tax=Aquilegia coerulea TaxID=218851 RepID=A0A2G5D4Z0_AQUCA|nr:hypothetical protein AQUCO_02700059v1 [Aquilegia coerulea]